jgi:hypothetical protein
LECGKYNGKFTYSIGDNMTKTTVASVGKDTKSVRTVIPMWIAEFLNLKKGTKIEWSIVQTSNGFTAQIKGDSQ